MKKQECPEYTISIVLQPTTKSRNKVIKNILSVLQMLQKFKLIDYNKKATKAKTKCLSQIQLKITLHVLFELLYINTFL